MKHQQLILAISTLFLAALACTLPGQNSAKSSEPPITEAPTGTITEEVKDAAAETIGPFETETLAEEKTEETTEETAKEAYTCKEGMLPGYAYSVEFCYPSAYASGFSLSYLIKYTSGANRAYKVYYPDRISLTLMRYPTTDGYHTATFYIFSVADYVALEPNIKAAITNLQTLLSSQDPNPTKIPYLPAFNAPQRMQAQVRYLNFRNGQGVRFITQYGRSYLPINNVNAFYAFSGLTDDGLYYISADLPVAHPNFAADDTIKPVEGWEVFVNNYETYITDLQTYLAGQPSNAFTPDLAALDAMMESLLVPPTTIP